MKFARAEDDLNNMLFHRHVSDDGKVEIAVYPVLFGFRVRAGTVGVGYCELDYCGGADQEMVERIYSMVISILEKQDSPKWNVFPAQIRKPMGNDPDCLKRLEELAGNHNRLRIVPLSVIRTMASIAMQMRF